MPIQFEFVGVLFADIEGFSKLDDDEIQLFTEDVLRELGDRVVNPHRPSLIDLNTWGDAIFATSRDVVDLARMALELRDFFLHPPRKVARAVEKKLRIRIALDFAQVRVAKNFVLSPSGDVPACFGRELTLAARIEPVTPPNAIFMTRALAEAVRGRDEQIKVVPFSEKLRLPKKAGHVQVFSLHWENEKVDVSWQDSLKRLEAIGPISIDPWLIRNVKERHKSAQDRLKKCEDGEKVCFISITGKSIIHPDSPAPGQSIFDVSYVAKAIERGARIRGIVFDPGCEEALFRSEIESPEILNPSKRLLQYDAGLVKGMVENQTWRPFRARFPDSGWRGCRGWPDRSRTGSAGHWSPGRRHTPP